MITEEIYKPPTSSLGASEAKLKRLPWRLYAWFIGIVGVPLMVFSGYRDYTAPYSLGIYDYLDYLVFFISLILLYGYAYNHKIFNRWAWWALAGVIVWTQFIRIAVYLLTVELSTEVYVQQTVGWAMVLPMHVAVFLYAYTWKDSDAE
ncbi:MAG: hypothetical protein DBP02_08430 [gamma proteobacterium symbiont of Ctena orbiculata]|nr:MAG: hypothetical protein DBP02_08430 [gamma proteobacterium symbiont of Ctena orbiculata]